MARRTRLSLLGAAVAVALCASTPGLEPAGAEPSLPPSSVPQGILIGVSARSAADAWAVGTYYDGTRTKTLTEHWNGMKWRRVASPSPGGSDGSYLRSVAAVSPTDAWAVGLAASKSLIERWDGTRWTPVANPGGAAYLFDVSAISANDVWAVGGQSETVTLHWDGTSWSKVPSPSPGSSNETWSVSAVSANDVWAVGDYNSGSEVDTLIMHWDGTSWTQVPSPSPGGERGSYLNSVSGLSANDAWAVGYYNGEKAQRILIEHWDGTRWSRVRTTSPPRRKGPTLYGVAAVSSSDVWAVGQRFQSSETLAEHWDGTGWTQVASPNPGGLPWLYDVDATSGTDVWAVGTNLAQGYATLIEHWDGQGWSIVPSP